MASEGDFLAVQHGVELLGPDDFSRLVERDLFVLRSRRQQLVEDALEFLIHLVEAHRGHDAHRDGLFLDGDLDQFIFQGPGVKLFAEFVARPLVTLVGLFVLGGVLAAGKQHIDQPLLDLFIDLVLDLVGVFPADHADRQFQEVANDGVHVAAVIADLGVLGGLDLDERGLNQLGEPAGDFRFADARSGRS